MFDTKFVESVKVEIERRLAANESTNRKEILKSLGFTQKGAEMAITTMFAIGLLPEYKMLKKMGIRPISYVSPAKIAKPAKPRKSKKADAEAVAA
jgi:predicted transcriptional regulator